MSSKGANCTMTLGFHQFYLNLVGERGRTSGCQGDLLDAQVINDFRVAIKMHGEGGSIERAGELDGGTT